jgi:hypothetical protein
MDTALEPHLKFRLKRRLEAELALRDPAQPFPEDPLPDEDISKTLSPVKPSRGIRVLSCRIEEQEKAKLAAQREKRFRSVASAAMGHRNADLARAASSRSAIRVANGGEFDGSLIEDRDYALEEVVRPNTRFKLRLIPWGGR